MIYAQARTKPDPAITVTRMMAVMFFSLSVSNEI
jgi:hypothetical protein